MIVRETVFVRKGKFFDNWEVQAKPFKDNEKWNISIHEWDEKEKTRNVYG